MIKKLYHLSIIAITLFSLILFASANTPNKTVAQPIAPVHPWYLVPTEIDSELIDDLQESSLPPEFDEGGVIANELSQTLLQIEIKHPELGFAGSEWDAETAVLAWYATADVTQVRRVFEFYDVPPDRVEVRLAIRDSVAKNEIVRKLMRNNGKLPSGHQIVTVIPSLDGSVFTVVLDENSRQEAPVTLPNVDAELKIEYGGSAEPVLRNHLPTPHRYAGAYMDQGEYSCTSGYRMTKLDTYTATMASAHHCGKSTFEQWYYGSSTNHLFGIFQGGLYPGGMFYGDITAWQGSGISTFTPLIFVGNNTVPGSSVFAVRGAVNPPVGSRVCYSGNRSGTVCGNTIINTGLGVCYLSVPVCYENIVETQQLNNLPAAGNGDSGGPVYLSAPQGVFAVGVISGIRDGTSSCTGDAGSSAPQGRKCSATVLYAPIGEMFGHGYGINYIPYS